MQIRLRAAALTAKYDFYSISSIRLLHLDGLDCLDNLQKKMLKNWENYLWLLYRVVLLLLLLLNNDIGIHIKTFNVHDAWCDLRSEKNKMKKKEKKNAKWYCILLLFYAPQISPKLTEAFKMWSKFLEYFLLFSFEIGERGGKWKVISTFFYSLTHFYIFFALLFLNMSAHSSTIFNLFIDFLSCFILFFLSKSIHVNKRWKDTPPFFFCRLII